MSQIPEQPRDKGYTHIDAAGSPLLAVVMLFWMARLDECRTDNTHAMPTGWPGLAYLAIQIQSVPQQTVVEKYVGETSEAHYSGTLHSLRKHLYILLVEPCVLERRLLSEGYCTLAS